MTSTIPGDLGRIPMSPFLTATLSRAATYAQAQSHVQVTVEHLLLALAEDPEATVVLRLSAIDIARLTSDVSAHLGRIEERATAGSRPEVVLSADLRRILEAAAAAAGQSRRREINGAILLAAIVGDSRTPAAHMLRAQGLTFEEAIRALQRSQAVAPPQAAPAAPPATGHSSGSTGADEVLAAARDRAQPRAQPPAERPQPAPVPHAPAQTLGMAGGSVAQSSPAPRDYAPSPKPATEAPYPLEPQWEPASGQLDSAVVVEQMLPPVPPASSRDAQPAPPRTGPPPAPLSTDYRGPQQNRSDTLGRSELEARSGPPPAPAAAPPPTLPAAQAPGAAPAAAPPPLQSAPQQWAPPPAAQPAPPAGTRPPARMPPPLPAAGAQQPRMPLPMGSGPVPSMSGAAAGGGMPNPSLPPQQRPAAQPPPASAPWADPGDPRTAGGQARAPSYERQPSQGPRSQPALQRAPVPDGRQRSPAAVIEAGQLVENIPRTMKVAMPAMVEARIARAEVKAITHGMQGGAIHRHEVMVAKAMTVRLRAPDGGFTIETASPETQWIDNVLGVMADDFASWRWSVTPMDRGRRRLQLIVSARTVGSDGLAAETALPDQVIEVKVGINYSRSAAKWAGWIAAAIIGGVLARFGDGVYQIGRHFIERLMSGA